MKICLTSDTHRGFSRNTFEIHEKWAKVLASEEFDILVLAGDIATSKQSEVLKSLEFFRDIAGDRVILYARGNHDMWQVVKNPRHDPSYSIEEILDTHRQWCKTLDIVLLDEGCYEYNNVLFGGFFTWYKNPGVTNDPKFMRQFSDSGIGIDQFLHNLEHQSLTHLSKELFDNVGKTRVVVSHMPCIGTPFDQKYTTNYNNFNALSFNCEYYMFGHSHQLWDGATLGGVKCYQSGSDYDKPKHMIIEV